ncbi:SDR family NAD(P)-dependent oxidoreductase [Mycolicibacterium sp. J2]|uniref:SDR family NAD(P)-dependent oxidoreductase n=1 Tax=Mycolicibacterium sp. J2 TaxID=2993511 RepID=UPI00224A7F6F|nr:SDR family NAD(P)-dependent oxidoreductase [Mycolicibacterium sp. J2]MCX2716072.1 SDR family NAD(P)-dependent oxidoreductase [Mycolicibacterium sp. J2]
MSGQTVVLVGGSAGIGLATARRVRAEGAEVVLTGRDPNRLAAAAAEVDAQRTAAFDATDTAALARFFHELPAPIDHVLVTAGGPRYRPMLDMGPEDIREALSGHAVLGLEVAPATLGRGCGPAAAWC